MSYFNLLVSYLVVKLLLVDVNGSGMGHMYRGYYWGSRDFQNDPVSGSWVVGWDVFFVVWCSMVYV